jgi:rhodanese-related sulfurtransferase
VLIAFACSSPDKKENDASSGDAIKSLPAQEFKEDLSEATNAVLIDVRTPVEVAEGIIPGAVIMDIKDSTFAEKITTLEKEKSYFVYCKSGVRSTEAAKQMEQAGLKNISVLDGGIVGWEEEGFETVKP